MGKGVLLLFLTLLTFSSIIILSIDRVSADERVLVPQNMCASGTKGLKCEVSAANRYCQALGFEGYVDGSMNCDGGGHGSGNWADGDAPLIHSCGSSESSKWILSMICEEEPDVVVIPVCGDGIIQRPNEVGFNEQCDDGNTANGDGCSNTCQINKILGLDVDFEGIIAPSPTDLILRGSLRTIPDHSGFGNNLGLVIPLDCTKVGVGGVGVACEFDKNSPEEYVRMRFIEDFQEDLGGFSSTEITVSAWVKPTAAPSGAGRVVVSTYKSDGEGESGGWLLGDPLGGTDHFGFVVIDPEGTVSAIYHDGFFAENLDEWTHVVGVYKSGEFLRLYINGVKFERITGLLPEITYVEGINLRVGIRSDVEIFGIWDGLIDEVKVYNYALEEDDVQALFEGQDVDVVVESECTGTAASCDTINDYNNCQDQRGCGWGTYTCINSPSAAKSCDNFDDDERQCGYQDGCTWEGGDEIPSDDEATCKDSDGGINFYIPGIVTLEDDTTYPDVCISDTEIEETSCSFDGSLNEQTYTCPGEGTCSAGVCSFGVTGGNYCDAIGTDPTIAPRTRLEVGGEESYCDPISLDYEKQKDIGDTCREDFECTTNSCLDNECFSVKAELSYQRGLIQNLFCRVLSIPLFGLYGEYNECLVGQFNQCIDSTSDSSLAGCIDPVDPNNEDEKGANFYSNSCIGGEPAGCSEFVTTDCGGTAHSVDEDACINPGGNGYDGCSWDGQAGTCGVDDCSLWNNDGSQCILAIGCTFKTVADPEDTSREWGCVNNVCEKVETTCSSNVCSENACEVRCTENDDQNDPFATGTCTDVDGTHYDTCTDDSSGDGSFPFTQYSCDRVANRCVSSGGNCIDEDSTASCDQNGVACVVG